MNLIVRLVEEGIHKGIQNQFAKLEIGGESPLTMRARCSGFRYCPNLLGIVTAEELDKLELVCFINYPYCIANDCRSMGTAILSIRISAIVTASSIVK